MEKAWDMLMTYLLIITANSAWVHQIGKLWKVAFCQKNIPNHYPRKKKLNFPPITVNNIFKFSAQDSDYEYFFEPHQTFWTIPLASKLKITLTIYIGSFLFSNEMTFHLTLRPTLHIFVASFWLDKRIMDVFFWDFSYLVSTLSRWCNFCNVFYTAKSAFFFSSSWQPLNTVQDWSIPKKWGSNFDQPLNSHKHN